jgi:DNA-binding HxlR family transcriptional regulator
MNGSKRRSNCPVSLALDAIGDKWSLIILRDIMINKKHKFRDLRGSDEGIASNILSSRLKNLVQQGILKREADTQDARQFKYSATDKGLDLLPLILELGAWGAQHCGPTTAPKGVAEAYYSDRESAIVAAREFARDGLGHQKK